MMLRDLVVWIGKTVSTARSTLEFACSDKTCKGLCVQALRLYVACTNKPALLHEFDDSIGIRSILHVGKCIYLSISVNVLPRRRCDFSSDPHQFVQKRQRIRCIDQNF